jgi:hypothetical protein
MKNKKWRVFSKKVGLIIKNKISQNVSNKIWNTVT